MPITASSFPRISARRGKVVDLNATFRRSGTATDPYAIRYVEIYKTSVVPHNLLVTIPMVGVDNALYPSPLYRVDSAGTAIAPGGTGTPVTGEFHLLYSIPETFDVPDVYYDVWYYFADNPCEGDSGTAAATDCDIDDVAYDSELLSTCHRFWLYPDEWFVDDGLQSIRFGFEPLDQKFHDPEIRPLEIGLMPLPLYDYNFNLVNPIIPYLTPTITIKTMREEKLVDDATMTIGLRQGSYRSNPWIMRYNLDTSKYLKGTYKYYITLTLPDGTTRVSKSFIFTIA